MFPIFDLQPIDLGFLKIFPWGIFVSAGFLAGLAAAFYFLKKHKMPTEKIFDLVFFIILGALVFSRLFHVLFYEPGYYFQHPLEILKIWQGGLSSMGGIFGGILAGLIYFKNNHLNYWRWLDALAFGLPLGWGIGRLGCFFTHQHLGIKSIFFLSVMASDGPRLEMSIIEAIVVFLIFGYFLLCYRRLKARGFYLIVFLFLYGAARFNLDFWRAYDLPGSDARYFGLTPAQYASLAMLIAGVILLIWRLKNEIKGQKIKAVIFDLDDTMVNSNPLHIMATDAVLKKYGQAIGNKISKQEKNNFVGMRVIDVLKIIRERLNLKISLDNLFAEREKIFLELVKNKLEVLHGLEHSLEFFKKNNFRLAMASSAVIEYIEIVLKKFKLGGYFEVIVAGDEVKNGKPDPEIYSKACQKLNLPPEQCLVVEDSRNGIESAKRAGCFCLAVKNKFTPPQDLSAADIVLESLGEINKEIVDSLN